MYLKKNNLKLITFILVKLLFRVILILIYAISQEVLQIHACNAKFHKQHLP